LLHVARGRVAPQTYQGINILPETVNVNSVVSPQPVLSEAECGSTEPCKPGISLRSIRATMLAVSRTKPSNFDRTQRGQQLAGIERSRNASPQRCKGCPGFRCAGRGGWDFASLPLKRRILVTCAKEGEQIMSQQWLSVIGIVLDTAGFIMLLFEWWLA